MKFKPKNYKENLTKLNELSEKLNAMIEDGSFYSLPYKSRRRDIRKVKSLYNKLRGPVSDAHLQQAVSFATVLMLITGARCGSDSSNNMSRVTIDLGLKNTKAVEATKAPAPSKITDISLTVTGEGMDDIVQSIPVDTGIVEFDVPSGEARTFEVQANLPTANNYLSGSAVADLEPDASVSVPITMALHGPPVFASAVQNPLGLTFYSENRYYPSFADIDGDGDIDLIQSKYNGFGGIVLFENETGAGFGQPQPNPFLYGGNAFKTFVDIDKDGDLDVYSSGYYSGYDNAIFGYENTGSSIAPVFNSPSYAWPAPFPFEFYEGVLVPNFYRSIMAFVDIDADGDSDLFLGGTNSWNENLDIQFLRNTGEGNPPVFEAPVNSPFGLSSIYNDSCVAPALADIDGDGDYDLFVGISNYDGGSYYGDILFFENTGSPTAPEFSEPEINPFGIEQTSLNRQYPALADIDQDGDLDLFIGGDNYGNILYFENTVL